MLRIAFFVTSSYGQRQSFRHDTPWAWGHSCAKSVGSHVLRCTMGVRLLFRNGLSLSWAAWLEAYLRGRIRDQRSEIREAYQPQDRGFGDS